MLEDPPYLIGKPEIQNQYRFLAMQIFEILFGTKLGSGAAVGEAVLRGKRRMPGLSRLRCSRRGVSGQEGSLV